MAEATYVVCVDESGKHDTAIRTAIERAAGADARLIMYDVHSAGAFSSPRPNIWAGEGAGEQYNHPLDPIELEKLGRHALAMQVKQAREAGVDAYGWLPESASPDALVQYAQREHAQLILVPTDLEQPLLTDSLANLSTVEFVG